MITELRALGWETQVLDLGSDFPWPSTQTRMLANAALRGVPKQWPLVIDGLAYGALPELAEKLRETHRLLALVHHPLALETGLDADQCAVLRASEEDALS